jgi:hypothetical protein
VGLGKIHEDYLLLEQVLRILRSVQRIRMRLREAQKQRDPTDPDPEHWCIYIILQR